MIDYTTRQISDAVTVVEVSGTFYESDQNYFFGCIGDMIDSGSRYIIIECHRLGHLNSAALASLLSARKHAAKKGGRIYLTHLSSSIAEVLEITKLGRLLSVYPSTESAIKDIQSDSACGG
jgi:anti-anti-sigma factor